MTADPDKRFPRTPIRPGDETRILTQVSSRLNTTMDPDEIFEIALGTMDEIFGFRHAMILLADDDSHLTVVASRGYGADRGVGATVPIGVGVIGIVAKKRRLLRVSHQAQQRAYAAAVRSAMKDDGRGGELDAEVELPGLPNAESQIAIPLLMQDHLVGVFAVESPDARPFDDRDEALVNLVANQLASAIHNSRLFAAERQRSHELAVAQEELREANRQLEQAAEHRRRIAQELLRDASRRLAAPLLGQSPAVRHLREGIEASAASDDPVMLVGKLGSGQEAVARAIHDASRRGAGALIYVNCKTLPTDTQPLFGSEAEPVSATGKIGLAHKGTLYLDGVNELPMATQRRLGKTLLEAERQHAGHANDGGLDVRVIASTSRDLDEELAAHRVDPLLHSVLMRHTLNVPPLAQRREDIPALVQHFIEQSAWRMGKTVERVSEASMQRLEDYRWPGNIHELQNVIERVVASARGAVLEIDEALLDEGIPVGRYRLVERIGVGGMGEVWTARHQLLDRPAVIKLIRADTMRNPSNRQRAMKRFEREAGAIANLRSPHTVELYDFGAADDGSLHYIMEHLEGLDLKTMVERFGPLEAERVVALLQQACLSLAEAHAVGLVHRDIKPANLFVSCLGVQFDFLKVLDFGIVQRPLDTQETMLTGDGQVAGTPAFMCPEAIEGSRTLTGKADIYSLGCVAYWMLTGGLVFEAESAVQMALRHATSMPDPPSARTEMNIPEGVDQIVMACLEKSPDRRPDAIALLEMLRALVLAEPWTPMRAERWWRNHSPEILARAQTSRS